MNEVKLYNTKQYNFQRASAKKGRGTNNVDTPLAGTLSLIDRGFEAKKGVGCFKQKVHSGIIVQEYSNTVKYRNFLKNRCTFT